MRRAKGTLPASYFDELYARERDPWRFASSSYERDKYAATLASLPRGTYASALEVGCSIGVLTRQLAARCDALLALDVSPAALADATERCADLSHVVFAQRDVAQVWPDGSYDLVLLSEVLYYLDRHDLKAVASRVGASLRPGGDVVLVHWLGATDYPLSGDEAADAFVAAAAAWPAVLLHSSRTDAYRLDVLRGPSRRSTASSSRAWEICRGS